MVDTGFTATCVAAKGQRSLRWQSKGENAQPLVNVSSEARLDGNKLRLGKAPPGWTRFCDTVHLGIPVVPAY
eukprot:6173723-Pleurochrysis_carterae.AAC.4